MPAVLKLCVIRLRVSQKESAVKISLNWIKSLNNAYQCAADPMPDGINALVEKIGAQLGAVEEVSDLGKKYKGIVVAKVVRCQKHPNADKLSVCLINDGRRVKNVKRDKNGLVQVVHGANNVEAGQLVAWLPPGVTVPSTHDREPLILESRNLRGVISHGMVGSAKELALGDDHEGILVIDQLAKPGQPFVEVYGLDDYIIDIENKMFTHRPDCFGFLGIARELAGIQGMVFRSPKWYLDDKTASTHKTDSQLLKVKKKAGRLVPRFMMQIVKNVKVGPSPIWIQAKLGSVDVRPINNIVDSTNATMLETAQPLHAYDYDKVKALSGAGRAQIVVRQAKKGESLKVLGGKVVKLSGEEIVIATDKVVIGLAGVIGGADTEVDHGTKNIILECGTFDMNVTRKTAMTHGLFTDAATRFTKNQSPHQNDKVLAYAIRQLTDVAGGSEAMTIYDLKPELPKLAEVRLTAEFVNQRLGLKLSPAQIKKLLDNVEFTVKVQANQLNVKAPFWRTDIAIAEDIVEEVGRLYGYDQLPLTLPKRDLSAAPINRMLNFKHRLSEIMRQTGANEVKTYSFVHGSLLKKAGQDPKNSYHIRNALSPQLQYYRQTLGLNLIEKVHPNIKAAYDNFALFEIGKCYFKGELDKDSLPEELERIALVVASKHRDGSAYFEAKKLCNYLLNELGIDSFEYEPVTAGYKPTRATYYEPSRSAHLRIAGRMAGWVGEFKPQVATEFKLPQFCAGFDLHIEEMLLNASANFYQPLNRFPALEQDFCLRAEAKYNYAQLEAFMRQRLNVATGKHGISYTISAIDIFRKPNDKEHNQTTWRINFWHPERTLTTDEINTLLDIIAKAAKTKLKAVRI